MDDIDRRSDGEASLDSLTEKGKACIEAADYAEALPLFAKAAQIARAQSDWKRQVGCLQAIAEIYRITGKIGDAIETYEAIIKVLEVVSDEGSIGRVYTNMAFLEKARDRSDGALAGFSKALAVFQRIGDRLHAAEQYGNIGSMHRDMDKHEEALMSYQEALTIYVTLGMKERIADQYTNIAYIYAMKDQCNEAMTWYQKALPLYDAEGVEEKAASTRQNIKNLPTFSGKEGA